MNYTRKKFSNKEQYLNYLVLDLLATLGNHSPLEEQIYRAETLVTYYCQYLNYLAIEFLKIVNNLNPNKRQVNRVGSLVANHSKKYFHELNTQKMTRKNRPHYLRKTNKT